MRNGPAYVLLFAALSIPAWAGAIDDKVPDEQSIHDLELRAAQAQPKDQCYLYSQLVHEMIEYSARQYAAGETEKASGLLKKAQEFTHKIRTILAGNDKKLKDAQILLRHTSFRLSEMLHASSYEDPPLVQETLAQLNQTQNDAMLQVFKK